MSSSEMPGRSNDSTSSPSASQTSTAGSQLEELPLAGAAPVSWLVQRLISFWSAASSRKGSQRTSAIA
jgi:hypothetical protein